MFFIDQLILSGSLLILVAIISRKFTAQFGVPVLVLFLLLGMAAGSEGIGNIAFDNYRIAHGIGTVALVVILFDGGLRTPRSSLRAGWKPALTLATVGVLITASITGLYAAWLLGISPLQGLLLGSIVASTDAAAVFAGLRSQGVRLNDRLNSTLEIESGSNDPMAIFLTVGLIEVLLGERSMGLGLASFFVLQIGLGLLFGILAGLAAAFIINRINLDAAGLYPVLAISVGFASYGITVFAGGSGFLAVYVTGIILGNSNLVFQRGTLLFHDGLAWISQIVMFVVLGLLSFPSELMNVAWRGLAVGAVLMFVARPAAVFFSLWPFRFSIKELILVSWIGLKGAVPIILGTFPLLFGLPNGFAYFNVVFFVVIVSALMQGWSLGAAARVLGLQVPSEAAPLVTLDITSLRHVNADIVDYEINEASAAAHLRISELSLPDDVVIAMVTRGREIIPARGATVLLPGDHVFLILRPNARAATEAVFRPVRSEVEVPLRAGILLPGAITIQELSDLYGVDLAGGPQESLEHLLRRQLSRDLDEGSFIETNGYRLYVHTVGEKEGVTIGVEEAPA